MKWSDYSRDPPHTSTSSASSSMSDRGGQSMNVKKRAALCAVKLIRMDAELADMFFKEAVELLAYNLDSSSKTSNLFLKRQSEYPGRSNAKSSPASPHGLVLSACHLMQVIVEAGTRRSRTLHFLHSNLVKATQLFDVQCQGYK